MTDQSNSSSGSRWEPADGATPSQDHPAIPPVPPLDDPAAEERRAQFRGRAILAGAATALTLGGGLTGYVIGHATAGDGSDDFRPANFSRQGPDAQFGEGQQQGPPSFRGDDGDGNGFGPQQGFDGASSSDDAGTTGSST